MEMVLSTFTHKQHINNLNLCTEIASDVIKNDLGVKVWEKNTIITIVLFSWANFLENYTIISHKTVGSDIRCVCDPVCYKFQKTVSPCLDKIMTVCQFT